MRALLSSLIVLAIGPGCAHYATSHLPYTPLLDHGGQVDISARVGASYPGGVPIAVNAAVALVDGLSVVANGDFNLGSAARHYGGGIGIGTFVPTDVFRLELIGGVNGGYSEGSAIEIGSGPGDYNITGSYLQPFGQLLLGFESAHFLFAGGVRVQGFLSEATAVEVTSGSTATRGYERMYVEPVVTFQFPFDIVRIEVSSSLPILVEGDAGPTAASIDAPVQWYLGVGVGVQFDAFAEEEPIYEPRPAYVPDPVAPPPEPVVTPPTAPAVYETGPATGPATAPATGPAVGPTAGGEAPPPPATAPTPPPSTPPAGTTTPTPAEPPGPSSPFTPAPR